MKLLARMSVLAFLFTLVAGAGSLFAQKGAVDVKVTYRDPQSGQETIGSGKIVADSIEGIVLLKGGKKISIPALNIVDLDYELPSFQAKQAYRRARNAEKEGDGDTALKIYQKFPKFTDPTLNRFLKFRVVMITTDKARKDPKLLPLAAKAWSTFRTQNPKSWQIMHMPQELLPLYFKNKDYTAARELMEEMLKVPQLPDSVRLEFTRKSLELLLREKKYGEAEKKLLALIKPLKEDDPQRLKLELTLAECRAADGRTADAEKALQAILDRAKSNDTKAIAYNGLSELYLKSGDPKQLEKAKWYLLYVELLYNQNSEERARALYNLHKVFAALKDTAKAERFKDALLSDKSLAGEYQDKLKAESGSN